LNPLVRLLLRKNLNSALIKILKNGFYSRFFYAFFYVNLTTLNFVNSYEFYHIILYKQTIILRYEFLTLIVIKPDNYEKLFFNN